MKKNKIKIALLFCKSEKKSISNIDLRHEKQKLIQA